MLGVAVAVVARLKSWFSTDSFSPLTPPFPVKSILFLKQIFQFKSIFQDLYIVYSKILRAFGTQSHTFFSVWPPFNIIFFFNFSNCRLYTSVNTPAQFSMVLYLCFLNLIYFKNYPLKKALVGSHFSPYIKSIFRSFCD